MSRWDASLRTGGIPEGCRRALSRGRRQVHLRGGGHGPRDNRGDAAYVGFARTPLSMCPSAAMTAAGRARPMNWPECVRRTRGCVRPRPSGSWSASALRASGAGTRTGLPAGVAGRSERDAAEGGPARGAAGGVLLDRRRTGVPSSSPNCLAAYGPSGTSTRPTTSEALAQRAVCGARRLVPHQFC